MTNLQLVIPGFLIHHGNGKGHQYGLNKNSDFGKLFGLIWVPGTWAAGARFTNPNYYGHWAYNLPGHNLNQLPAEPDFFQVLNYALKKTNGGVSNPDQVFNLGAALIDQYDGDDLYDPDGGGNGDFGNTITIIDYGGASYAYGIEGMSWDDPTINLSRPPFAPNPLTLGVPATYALLNRRFENVGEFGYAYKPGSTLASRTLDFASATSPDRALLDFFTYNTASRRAGIVNLNTRNGPVLASIINGALLHDLGTENTPTPLVSRSDALAAAQAVVQETTSTTAGRGPAVTRADVARLAAAAAAALPGFSECPTKQSRRSHAPWQIQARRELGT
jgi:hypothetical protein